MNPYENIKVICKEQNTSVSQVEEDTGIPRNYLANWGDEPRWTEYLPLVAKRLGVSIDYIFYLKNEPISSALEKVVCALGDMPLDDDAADSIISIAKIITSKYCGRG